MSLPEIELLKSNTINNLHKGIALHHTVQYLCSIYDMKTQKYDPPFVTPTKLDALRGIQNSITQQPTSNLAVFPQDYQLHCLGTFSTDGNIDTFQKPEIMANMTEFTVNK